MKNQDLSYFDYFSGGVPSGEIFLMAANDIVNFAREKPTDRVSNRYALCLIGIVSYFEAFVKAQLATSISIAPTLIKKLQHMGVSTEIASEDALEHREQLRFRIGFLICEKLDLGSAKRINSLYSVTLKISPFGNSETLYYDRLLRDRNLIVHHGSVYTCAYIRQAFSEIDPLRRRAHENSLCISLERIEQVATFLKTTAQSIVALSAERLLETVRAESSVVPTDIAQAISTMAIWDESYLDDYEEYLKD